MAKSNGVIVWQGPSQIDGAPIMLVAVGLAKPSTNEKTGGNIIQTFILRSDMSPIDAVDSGADSAICGACPHRGVVVDGKNKDRSCYVTVFQAPHGVYKTARKGKYPTVSATEFAALRAKARGGNLGVRLGSYGDPAAVPFEVWEAMLDGAPFWTGYTHQWRNCDIRFARYLMASCDAPCDKVSANILGYRTFRVHGTEDAARFAREIVCPASEEAGKKTTCDTCRACGGTAAKARVDIAIAVHGTAPKVNAYMARA